MNKTRSPPSGCQSLGQQAAWVQRNKYLGGLTRDSHTAVAVGGLQETEPNGPHGDTVLPIANDALVPALTYLIHRGPDHRHLKDSKSTDK